MYIIKFNQKKYDSKSIYAFGGSIKEKDPRGCPSKKEVFGILLCRPNFYVTRTVTFILRSL